MIARRRRTNSGNSETDANRETQYNTGYTNYNQTGRTYVETLPPPTRVAPPVDDMTCRDRTNEFMSAVKSMQSRQVN